MTRKGNCRLQIADCQLTQLRNVARHLLEVLESRQLLTSNLVALGAGLNDAVFAVATMPDGGRVIAGTFGETIDFDPGAGERILTAQGDSDIFLARHAADGSLMWAQSFGGIGGEIDDEPFFSVVQATTGDFSNNVGPTITYQGEYVSAMKVGADGLIYVGGSFQQTVDFDPTAGTVNRMTPDEDYHDAFVAAYNSTDGTLVWVSAFGGVFDDTVRDLVVPPDGGVIATGYYTREGDFNPTKSGVKFVEALGRDDLFVIKLSQTDSAPIGRLQWVYTAGGEAVRIQDRDVGEGIALDGNGNVYVTGTFAAEADFDPSSSELIIESLDDRTDGFILCLSPRGKLDYVQSFGGEEADGGKNIAIDNMGRMYLSGYFSETADLDPGNGVTVRVAREEGDAFDLDEDDQDAPPVDLFLSQISLRGELQWTKQIGGDDFEYLADMQVVDDGDILLSGAFAGRIFFDATEGLDSAVSVLGDDDFDDNNDRESSYDAFIAQYQSDGTFVESRQYGGSGDDWANDAVFKADRSSAEVVGIFRNTATFNGFGTGIKRKAVALQDLFALSSV